MTKLSSPDYVDTGPQAEAIASFAKGWNPKEDSVTYPKDFPGTAHVTATKKSGESIAYDIAWRDAKVGWVLVIGKLGSGSGASPRATVSAPQSP